MPISNERFVSRIYNISYNSIIKSLTKHFNKQLIHEDIGMMNKHIQENSALLAIREMLVKIISTTKTPTCKAGFKKLIILSIGEDVEWLKL